MCFIKEALHCPPPPRRACSIETVMSAQWYDGNISLPGCDKNMPGTLMAMARLNRPAIMVYGGTIKPGAGKQPQNGTLDIVSAFESYGKVEGRWRREGGCCSRMEHVGKASRVTSKVCFRRLLLLNTNAGTITICGHSSCHAWQSSRNINPGFPGSGRLYPCGLAVKTREQRNEI